MTTPLRYAAACVLALMLVGCGGGGGGSDGVSTFSKSYGGPLHDEASVVLQADDGGMLLFGTADAIYNFNEGSGKETLTNGDFWVQKLDANGNVERTRLIGVRSNTPPGTIWANARPGPDGSSFVVGTTVRRRPFQGTGLVVEPVVGSDIAVTKLDAAGRALWTVSHDSGAWLNYDYFTVDSRDPEAEDFGEELWPLADGGVLVVGVSRANLEDRVGAGFSCADAELDELRGSPCAGSTDSAGGNRYIDAKSLVLMRLDPDGSLRWVRRFNDQAFDALALRKASGGLLRPIVRTLADGGIVLARPVNGVGGALIVRRLTADGAPLWRRVVPDADGDVTSLVQTDDPVSGRDGDLHDGVRNDGLLMTTPKRVTKLAASGAIEWSVGIDFEGAEPDDEVHRINGVEQRCDYGRPTRCEAVVIGSSRGGGGQSPARLRRLSQQRERRSARRGFCASRARRGISQGPVQRRSRRHRHFAAAWRRAPQEPGAARTHRPGRGTTL